MSPSSTNFSGENQNRQSSFASLKGAVRLLLVLAYYQHVNVHGQPPDFAWAAKIGGGLDQGGSSIAVDAVGNCYVAGVFLGTATFGTTSLNSRGEEDAFLAKYDASGNLLWAKSGGGRYEDFIFGNAVDGSGNCYVAGAFGIFSETAVFGTMSLTSTNLFDTFLAKYSATGSVLWVKPVQRTTTHFGALDVAADAAGDSYLAGEFSGVAKFGTSFLTSAGANDVFWRSTALRGISFG